MMMGGKFEYDDGRDLRKPRFFFDNAIILDDSFMLQGTHRWLRTINKENHFLLVMQRMYGLAYLQHLSIPRNMKLDLVPFVREVLRGD